MLSKKKKKKKTYVFKSVRGEYRHSMDSDLLNISKPTIQTAEMMHEIPKVVDNPRNVGT
jgi:hypothetical protein